MSTELGKGNEKRKKGEHTITDSILTRKFVSPSGWIINVLLLEQIMTLFNPLEMYNDGSEIKSVKVLFLSPMF